MTELAEINLCLRGTIDNLAAELKAKEARITALMELNGKLAEAAVEAQMELERVRVGRN